MRAARIAFELALVAFVAYVLVSTYGLRQTARMVPWVIAVPTLLMLLAVIIAELGKSEQHDNAPPFIKEARLFAGALAWIAALFIATLFFGFFISVAAFLLAYLTFVGQLKAWQNLLAALAVLGIIWGLFVKGMGMRVFEGMLFGAQLPPL